MGWFSKKKDSCNECGMKMNASECVKTAEGKCLCQNCAAKQPKK